VVEYSAAVIYDAGKLVTHQFEFSVSVIFTIVCKFVLILYINLLLIIDFP